MYLEKIYTEKTDFLVKYLEILGYTTPYENCPEVSIATDGSKIYDRKYLEIDNGAFEITDYPDDGFEYIKDRRLFKALAALRDDSDINQYFIYDDTSNSSDGGSRFIFVCHTDCIEDDMWFDQMYLDCTKMTRDDLKDSFKNNDPNIIDKATKLVLDKSKDGKVDISIVLRALEEERELTQLDSLRMIDFIDDTRTLRQGLVTERYDKGSLSNN